MIRRPAVILVILLLPAGPAAGDGLRSLADGWLLEGPDEAAVLDGRPRSRMEGTSAWFTGGVTRLFGMEDLPVSVLGLGLAAPRWSVGLGWQRTGRTLFVEDRLDVVLRLGSGPRLGLRVGMATWSVRGFDSSRAWDPALEFTLGSGTPWSLRFLWHPTEAPAWYGRTGRREWVRAAWIGGGAAVALALDRDADGVPAVGVHASWRLGAGLALGIRADPATGSLGPCLTAAGNGLTVRTAHLAHPALGLTHRITVGVGDLRAAPW